MDNIQADNIIFDIGTTLLCISLKIHNITAAENQRRELAQLPVLAATSKQAVKMQLLLF